MRVRAFIHKSLKPDYQESIVSDANHVQLELSNGMRRLDVSVTEDKGFPYGYRLEIKYLEGDLNRFAESVAVFKNNKLEWLNPDHAT